MPCARAVRGGNRRSVPCPTRHSKRCMLTRSVYAVLLLGSMHSELRRARCLKMSSISSTYRCILDVAGGPGSISIQIGLRHPHLKGIVMDMAPVCAIAREHIQRNNLADRFTAVAADLFAGPYPEDVDVIVLASILHDWNEPECQLILRNCFDSLPRGGLLLVVEKVLNNDFAGARLDDLMQDLHMLLVSRPGARERTEAEFASLLLSAGFGSLEVKRLAAPRDVILTVKN